MHVIFLYTLLDPGACKLNVSHLHLKPTVASEDASTSYKKNFTIFRAPGAGRSRGLTIMTDTLRCGDVPTDSFKGLRVVIYIVSKMSLYNSTHM